MSDCPRCQGTGLKPVPWAENDLPTKCGWCDGTGRKRERRPVVSPSPAKGEKVGLGPKWTKEEDEDLVRHGAEKHAIRTGRRLSACIRRKTILSKGIPKKADKTLIEKPEQKVVTAVIHDPYKMGLALEAMFNELTARGKVLQAELEKYGCEVKISVGIEVKREGS